jgi:hypothetical protein
VESSVVQISLRKRRRLRTLGGLNSPHFLRRRPFLAVLGAITGLLALSIAPLRADTIALSFTGGVFDTASGATVGWRFSSIASISLTQLGVWDMGGDGLVDSHQVTVWDSTGTMVAQLVVPSGTASPLIDGFRYAMLPVPALLFAGTYTIGALYSDNADPYADRATTSTAPGITYDGSRSRFGDAFPAGDVFDLNGGYFGPNFQFNAVAVPESGATLLWLLGASVIALGAPRRRKVRGH